MNNNRTILDTLPSCLQDTVVDWIHFLLNQVPRELRTKGIGPIVLWVVDQLIDLMYPDDDFENYISEKELIVLQTWDADLPDGSLYQLVNSIYVEFCAVPTPSVNKSRKATDKQLQIIRELQEDTPDIIFDECFSQLSTWQAHTIISGLLVISEVVRCTGRREMKPGDLRRSIRNFIENNRDRYPYRR